MNLMCLLTTKVFLIEILFTNLKSSFKIKIFKMKCRKLNLLSKITFFVLMICVLCILEPELVTDIMPKPGRCRRGRNACPICGGTGSVIDADGEAESCECINGADGSCRWCVVHQDVCFI